MNSSVTRHGVDRARRTDLRSKRNGKLILPTGWIHRKDTLIYPGRNFGRLLPVTPPKSRRRGTHHPSRITRRRRPKPSHRIIRAMKIMTISRLQTVRPRVVTRPTRRMNKIFIRLNSVATPRNRVLPIPMRNWPTSNVRRPRRH